MEAAASFRNATLRDYAQFRIAIRKQGEWKGKQILPERWVEEATTPQRSQVQPVRVDGTSLGYGWWTLPGRHHAFSAWGRFQQFIYVNPTYGIVIVKTSASKPDDSAMETFCGIHSDLWGVGTFPRGSSGTRSRELQSDSVFLPSDSAR